MAKKFGRLRHFSADRDVKSWVQPIRAECEEVSTQAILASPWDYLQIRKLTMEWLDDRGRVVDFCFELQIRSKLDSNWTVVYRADCKHGTAHEHNMFPTGEEQRTILRRIGCLRDVEEASISLSEYLQDSWESKVERWVRWIQ